MTMEFGAQRTDAAYLQIEQAFVRAQKSESSNSRLPRENSRWTRGCSRNSSSESGL
jgi:hypothetical protein